MKIIRILSSTKVVISITAIFLALYYQPVSGKCKTAEVEICSTDPSKGCFCKTCISCPVGYGPSHPCGDRYVNGTVIRCKPCITNKNYSAEYSIASCQPCRQCGGRETLQKCTPKSETSCSMNCRPGYYMNHAVEECIPDPSFMTSTQQTDPTKLTTITMPTKTTTQKPTDGTVKPSHPVYTSGIDGPSKSEDDTEHSRDNKIILAVICTIISIALMVFVAHFLYKRITNRRNTKDQQEEKKALTSGESPRTSQEIFPWPESLRLREIKESLRTDVTNQISKASAVYKYWPAIAEKLGIIDPLEIEAIELAGEKQGTTPGLELFRKLKTCRPELTLTEFVNTLESLGRKDVSKTIKDYYRQVNTVSIQIDTQQLDQV